MLKTAKDGMYKTQEAYFYRSIYYGNLSFHTKTYHLQLKLRKNMGDLKGKLTSLFSAVNTGF